MDKKQLTYKIVSEGVKNLLEEAKVPMKVHMRVVEKLHKTLEDHAKDRKTFQESTDALKEQLKAAGVHDQKRQAILASYHKESERLQTVTHLKGDQGDRGEPGLDGMAPSLEEIVTAVLPHIPTPQDGKDGNHGKDGKNPEVKSVVEEVIKLLQTGNVLHASHVKGMGSFVKDGVKYRFEELMHGGGSSTPSSGLTIITVTGTIDDSNATFTMTSKPTLVNINGAFYQSTGGAITWSYSGGTLTLSSPVGTGGQIYGLK